MPGAGELRALRRRIRSVKSTQKITRAMELIAASRINKARNAVESARPYAEGIGEVIAALAATNDVAGHPLLAPREQVKRVAIVVITSDRGLAGAYNTNVLRRAERLAKSERSEGRDVTLYSLGRKAETYFRYRGQDLAGTWHGITDKPQYASAAEVGKQVMSEYAEGRIDRVWLAFTEFRSALSQVARIEQVLPVPRPEKRDDDKPGGAAASYEFEPDPTVILEALVPRYVEQQIFAGLLEGAASEHASRQRAMKAATDNAGDLLDALTREANAARQAAITTEISEIVGGAEALSSH